MRGVGVRFQAVMNHLHFIDYFIILLVLGITLWLGFRLLKDKRQLRIIFYLKEISLHGLLGLSLLSTLISSVTFLGYPAQGYTGNWILLVQGLMVPIVLLGAIWFIVPLYRKGHRSQYL
jgi:SSS family solute:Na+ symporter